jgi:post-segregation antitoxin (ccd killing protein)
VPKGRPKANNESVRCNVYMPAELHTEARRLNLNVSRILQNALAVAVKAAQRREQERNARVDNALDTLGF